MKLDVRKITDTLFSGARNGVSVAAISALRAAREADALHCTSFQHKLHTLVICFPAARTTDSRTRADLFTIDRARTEIRQIARFIIRYELHPLR